MDSTTLNLIFSGISAVCAVISIVKCNEIKNLTKNNEISIKGKNNNTGDITGGDKVNIEKYVAQEIINDEEFIKEVSTKIAIALIDQKTPKYQFDEKTGTLNIDIPESEHKLRLERK